MSGYSIVMPGSEVKLSHCELFLALQYFSLYHNSQYSMNPQVCMVLSTIQLYRKSGDLPGRL